jgi:putative endonuclease
MGQMERGYAVYILASKRNGTLYTGVTSDLSRRVYQHRNGTGGAFTRKYGVTQLVHIELFSEVHDAIAREKAIKKWRRVWKLELIEKDNPSWRDRYDELIGL